MSSILTPPATPKTPYIPPCTPEEYTTTVRKFLTSIRYEPQPPPKILLNSILPSVLEHFTSIPFLPPYLLQITVQTAPFATNGILSIYPFLPLPTLLTLSIFMTYIFTLDDHSATLRPYLSHFTSRLLDPDPKPNLHPFLNAFTHFLPTLRDHYGPYACAMTLKASIDYIQSCLVESRYDDESSSSPGSPTHHHHHHHHHYHHHHHHPHPHPGTSPKFPHFFRLKTAYAEPFAHFCFPQARWPEDGFLHVFLPAIPDLVSFIGAANDVLSFYKESVVGRERFNFVWNLARTKTGTGTGTGDTATDLMESARDDGNRRGGGGGGSGGDTDTDTNDQLQEPKKIIMHALTEVCQDAVDSVQSLERIFNFNIIKETGMGTGTSTSTSTGMETGMETGTEKEMEMEMEIKMDREKQEMWECVRSHLMGQVAFYLSERRYRLEELQLQLQL